MLQITPQMKVLVAVEPADFRQGIDGLAQLCRDVLRQNPLPARCSSFAIVAAQRSKCWCTTARVSGFVTNDCLKGGFAGGRRNGLGYCGKDAGS